MAFTLPPSPDQLKRKALRGQVIQQTEMFDRLDMPLLQITGTKGRIRWANAAALALLGDDIWGKRFTKVFEAKALRAALKAFKTLEAQAQEDLVVSAKNLPGRGFKARLVRLDKKTLQGARVLVALTDITEILNLDTQRAEFVANASHELKSPVTALAGFIETLNIDPAALPAFLPLMTKETNRMRRLLADLLSLARLEMAGDTRTHRPLRLAALLDMAADASASIMDRQGHRLSVTVANLWIRGDEGELGTAFTNLLINAAKYSPAASHIQVQGEVLKGEGEGEGEGEAEAEGSGVDKGTRLILIHFDNPGPGIPAEHIPRLTERFYRIDNGRARADGGTGLGLAIVKHILLRHGGELHISSPPAGGARFTVTLPGSLSDSPSELGS